MNAFEKMAFTYGAKAAAAGLGRDNTYEFGEWIYSLEQMVLGSMDYLYSYYFEGYDYWVKLSEKERQQ